MRVALYGNVCNNMYNIAKALRKHSKIEPHLYLTPVGYMHSRPESDDPELNEKFPEWIHQEKRLDVVHFFKSLTLDRAFIKELNSYDAIIASDIGAAIAPYVKPKVFFWTTGSDITRLPFPKEFKFYYKSFFKQIRFNIIGALQRNGLRKVHQFWTQPYYPFIDALNSLGIKKERISTAYFPIIVDTDLLQYNPRAINSIDPVIRKQFEPFRFKIFHPARLMINRHETLMRRGQVKGNDMLFYGFARFMEKYKVKDACIVLPNRTASIDVDLGKKIIKDLGIEDNIVWINGKSQEGFTKSEMADLYSATDMTADDFNVGWFGSILVEATSCGRPMLNYIDEKIMKELYPWHPIISANTPDTVADAIARVYFDSDFAREIGEKSREWVMEFHSPEKASLRYVSVIEKLLSDNQPAK